MAITCVTQLTADATRSYITIVADTLRIKPRYFAAFRSHRSRGSRGTVGSLRGLRTVFESRYPAMLVLQVVRLLASSDDRSRLISRHEYVFINRVHILRSRCQVERPLHIRLSWRRANEAFVCHNTSKLGCGFIFDVDWYIGAAPRTSCHDRSIHEQVTRKGRRLHLLRLAA